MDEAMKLASQQVESGNVPEFVESAAPATPAQAPQTAEKIEPIPESVDIPMPSEGEGSETSGASSETLQRMQDIINKQQATIAKLSTIINVHTNQLSEVGSTGDKFNKLVAEIAEIKTELKKLKESPVMPAPNSKGQTSFKPSSPPPAPQTPQPPEGGRAEEAKQADAPPKQQGSGHARSGNYQSDDVSIEKFFYYGGK